MRCLLNKYLQIFKTVIINLNSTERIVLTF